MKIKSLNKEQIATIKTGICPDCSGALDIQAHPDKGNTTFFYDPDSCLWSLIEADFYFVPYCMMCLSCDAEYDVKKLNIKKIHCTDVVNFQW